MGLVKKILSNMLVQKSGKIGQNGLNLALVRKILYEEKFCPTKILTNEFLSDKVLFTLDLRD